MRVLVLTIGDAETGSTKYRFAQYTSFLQSQGIEIEYMHKRDITRATVGYAASFDLVINQKCLFNSSLARRIVNRAPRTVFDFDDAIWTRPGKPFDVLTRFRVHSRLRHWLTHADVVTTSNNYLAEYARRFTANVRVIPMALNLEEWTPARRVGAGPICIGWAGSPVNLKYLERIDVPLTTVIREHADVRLMVFSGKRPDLQCPFTYCPYESGKEAEFTRQLDIGLLPLDEDEYLKGKSPIKAIQYLACAVPVVGNIVGATAEILTPENSIGVATAHEWVHALNHLVANRETARNMGLAGRRQAEANHDSTQCRQALLSVMG